jgi:hypothetical protein
MLKELLALSDSGQRLACLADLREDPGGRGDREGAALQQDPHMLDLARHSTYRPAMKRRCVLLRSFDGSRDRVVSGWPVLCHG